MEDESDEKSEEFRIRHTQSDEYSIHPASGVLGGVQLNGDFMFEFYAERFDYPDEEVYEMTAEGDIGQYLGNEGHSSGVVKEKQVGVSMNQQNAFDLATWTIAKLLGDGVEDVDVEAVLVEAFEDRLQNEGDSE